MMEHPNSIHLSEDDKIEIYSRAIENMAEYRERLGAKDCYEKLAIRKAIRDFYSDVYLMDFLLPVAEEVLWEQFGDFWHAGRLIAEKVSPKVAHFPNSEQMKEPNWKSYLNRSAWFPRSVESYDKRIELLESLKTDIELDMGIDF